MTILDLNGAWQLRQKSSAKAYQAAVPGCVHADLLANKAIPDPFVRDNEEKLLWVGDAEWTYERRFDVPRAFLENTRVLLRCEGLDTLATLRINGRRVASTDNMFRTYEFDVKRLLRPGANTISITFAPPLPWLKAKQRAYEAMGRCFPGWGSVPFETRLPRGVLRKMACNFGWDWGVVMVTCGIHRPISLVAYDTARLTNVRIGQRHTAASVAIVVTSTVERVSANALTVRATVRHKRAVVASASAPVRGGSAHVPLKIANPELWWPNGLGAQPLYEVIVEVLDSTGTVIDRQSKRIGLRTLRLTRNKDRWGESFCFECNGVPFFAKGANWIPADAVYTRVTPARYRRLVADAAAANMNMLRVWGGGMYEHPAFYNACDELGICIWHDFMFACNHLPLFDKEFIRNACTEAEQQVKSLRHHPSIALWCGNNELEMGGVADSDPQKMRWPEYKALFDVALRKIVNKHHAGCDYWPSSPHSPYGDRGDHSNPRWGDAHLWAVWHGRQPFEHYRTCQHRFNSEFGFQSFPEPRTVRSYTAPCDRNVTTRVMELHQRSHNGNAAIMHYMLDWFRLPTGLDNTLWASQILQGMAIKYAVEHWRRSMPRGMGTLYWQYNDTWPVASWASVDYFGRWKALHYMARHFYASVLLSLLEDSDNKTVEIHVTNDLLEDVRGTIEWTLHHVDGRVLERGTLKAHAKARANTKIAVVNLRNALERHLVRNVVFSAKLTANGGIVSSNLATFVRPKHLELGAPGITARVRAGRSGSFAVTLTARRFAPWAWLELADADAEYSDNFVHLLPGQPVTIAVTPREQTGLAAFKRQLRVRSLVDTYAD
ncbi:glycoside hydrolase family 2 protein [bacterium]|nr:glycoside hydrolase family 2 protein [bacterium]